jgi:hypothetical protein
VAEHEVTVTKNGFSIALDQYAIEAVGIIRERGSIRATVSITNGSQSVIFRDNVNLTGEKSRLRVKKRLEEKKLGIASSVEGSLLALDEGIRQFSFHEQKGPKNNSHDTLMYFPEKVPDLVQLKAIFARWLLISDPHFLEVPLAVIKAHHLGGESPWLLINAPPSTLKTELIRALAYVPGVYPISDLTARTLASGLDSPERQTSLLARLSNELLVLKDFTTMLELRSEERQAVMAQLREIYDGRFDKVWGTGKELHWEGRLGFIAGVTNVIDQHHHVMAVMGPRFLQFRVEQPDREKVAKRAMSNSQAQDEMRQELAGAVAQFLDSLPSQAPAVPDEAESWLAKVADVVTRARSPVLRDGYRRELDYAPEPEGPARFAKQLKALTQGVALINGRDVSGPYDLALVTRVAHDCIDKMRQVAIEVLLAAPDGLNISEIAHNARFSTSTVRRALEDLEALGLVRKDKTGPSKADTWWLEEQVRDVMKLLFVPAKDIEQTFSEKYMKESYKDIPVETGRI